MKKPTPRARKTAGKARSGTSPALLAILLLLIAGAAVYILYDKGAKQEISRRVKTRVPPGEERIQPEKTAAELERRARERTGFVPLSKKRAAALVDQVFGGRPRGASERHGRYVFDLRHAKKAYPFKQHPRVVEVEPRLLSGPFAADGTQAELVFMAVEDPDAPTWVQRSVGVLAFARAGAADKPAVLGAFAIEAPEGWFTRTEAFDAEGDGRMELLVEAEFSGPGGILKREASVWSFGGGKSKKLWSDTSLDDAPGQGAERAAYLELNLRPREGGGTYLEIIRKVRTYKVDENFARTLVSDEVAGVETRSFGRN